ncbi:MAG: hypothetical protein PHR64_03730 [Candidatus Shapirobacteria bacterium]|nr:hypothetical protein [Candidatus Shapirobacteria bacterium]MDD5074118.1 hypothetical protein [Candidatus Shapirobacteria bacterium]MDD5482019.1 hypothetical protein [Candidatus Shapirobacteria bacterium]
MAPSFGKRFLYCLTLVFFCSCAVAGAFMVATGTQWVVDDIQLSIAPMRKIGLPEATALGLSIMSSVSEVIAGLLFLDLKEVEKAIRNEPAYRAVLPIMNEKTLLGARVYFVLMLVYDVVTNIWGSFMLNPNPLTVFIQVVFLTLSEYFVVLGLAFVLAVIWFGSDVLRRMKKEEAVSFQES